MSRRLLIVVSCCIALGPALPAFADGPPQGVTPDGAGIISPDGKLRYLTVPTASRTLLEEVNLRDGTLQTWRWLDGSLAIPAIAWHPTGLTHDGKTLVLATYPWRTGSATFLLLNTPYLTTERVVTLKGAWSFDAISPRARTLYLIQGLPGRYLVRAYDLRRGRLLTGAIADRREKGPMSGAPVTRATTTDGRWAYTLYLRGNGTGFIHALDTVGRTAVCIDLPWEAMDAWAWDAQLWVSRDGRTLHLRQRGTNGRHAVVDTRTWKLKVSSTL